MKRVQPVFQRVLDCFETKVQFAESVGQMRQVVNYWVRIGFIPPEHALEASRATGNRVGAIEILNEANRQMLKRKAVREELKARAQEAASDVTPTTLQETP